MSNSQHYDVIVVGAGMVGGAVASLLARCGFSLALVEGREPTPFDPVAEYDTRVSALSPGTMAILAEAGAWREIDAQRHCRYRRMEIEDQDSGASLAFDAAAYGLDHLGAIVENSLVQSALWRVLQNNPMVDIICPQRLQSLTPDTGRVQVELDNGSRMTSEILLGADGPDSAVRRMCGVDQDVWEYNQAGLVCLAEKELLNPGIAWQRFMPGGPLAFLPLSDGRSSIVWTRPSNEAKRLAELPAEVFLQELESASSGFLGSLKQIGERAVFPLAMRLNHNHVAGRVVLLGDAAHVVHPLAGQGVNLGIADAAALVESLAANRAAGQDLADPSSLRAYEIWRKSESGLMSWGIHGLGGLFSQQSLGGFRRLGMDLVSRSWILKEAFVKRAAGLNRNAPKLSRGDTLKSLLAR